jgi:hypothetical protein
LQKMQVVYTEVFPLMPGVGARDGVEHCLAARGRILS